MSSQVTGARLGAEGGDAGVEPRGDLRHLLPEERQRTYGQWSADGRKLGVSQDGCTGTTEDKDRISARSCACQRLKQGQSPLKQTTKAI